MKDKINILNNNIVETFGNEYLGAYYKDVLVDYYTTNTMHTPIFKNINKILIAKDKDTEYDFSQYNLLYLFDEVIIKNEGIELNDNCIPILRVSNIDACEKILDSRDKFNEIHVIVDNFISWNLLEYLLREKSDYIRIILDENSLKYMNFTADNTIESIYKLSETILPTTSLELEIISPKTEISSENELDLVLKKYLPNKENVENKVIIENKWSQVLRVLKEFTPNIIHTKEEELINMFNTQDTFDCSKPLVLYNSTNNNIDYYLKSMYLLNTFRTYKKIFKEVNDERQQIGKSKHNM